jgi:hypothetical protein
MASDDDNRAATKATEFKHKLEAMVTTAETTKKKADAARARVLAAAALLEEEQQTAATLEDEARAASFLIEPPPPTSKTETGGPSLAPNTVDYEAAVIANLHVQATGVLNICSLVSVVLDSSSTHYARWRDNVLLTLRRYALTDHVLSDATFPNVPAWDRMDIIVRSWIYNTISPELQDMTRQNGHTASDACLALENRFIGNRETHALHIDATFCNFVQGGLNMNDYCWKMKGFADSLNDLGAHVSNRVLVLNVLRDLNKQYEHLHTIFTHTTPFQCFQKVRDDLCLEEI